MMLPGLGKRFAISGRVVGLAMQTPARVFCVSGELEPPELFLCADLSLTKDRREPVPEVGRTRLFP